MSTYVSLSPWIRNFRLLCSVDAMGLYITSALSTIDVSIGLGAKISNSELRDTDMVGGESQTNVT